MEKEQNHYKVLGVEKNADTEEIKRAYRTAARKYHPDTEGGDSETFCRVGEAFEVLSDQDQRYRYDRHRFSI